jgi:hypothetical protein
MVWNKDLEKAEIFRKVEPYLIFLNIPQLERQGADIQSKVEELEEINQSLRNRDKLKDDAISQLSDQLVSLSTRSPEIIYLKLSWNRCKLFFNLDWFQTCSNLTN